MCLYASSSFHLRHATWSVIESRCNGFVMTKTRPPPTSCAVYTSFADEVATMATFWQAPDMIWSPSAPFKIWYTNTSSGSRCKLLDDKRVLRWIIWKGSSSVKIMCNFAHDNLPSIVSRFTGKLSNLMSILTAEAAEIMDHLSESQITQSSANYSTPNTKITRATSYDEQLTSAVIQQSSANLIQHWTCFRWISPCNHIVEQFQQVWDVLPRSV